MGRNTENKDMNQSKKFKQKLKQRDNFCYRKVGRAITKWGAIKKIIISKGYQKLFRSLVVAITFSPTV